MVTVASLPPFFLFVQSIYLSTSLFIYLSLHSSCLPIFLPISVVSLQSLQELSVTKGELVKVTNAAMDKKWCIVVNTEGRSGSVKKKYLERVEPGRITISSPHWLISYHEKEIACNLCPLFSGVLQANLLSPLIHCGFSIIWFN